MLETSSSPRPEDAAPADENINWSRLIRWVSISLTLVVVAIFLFGLYLAFSNAPVNAPRIQVIREVLTTTLLLLSIIVVTAIALLILQIIRLVSTLRHETRPILDTTRETLSQAKGSVEFIGQQVSEPIIRVSAWSAGLGLLIRDLGGIRRALRRQEPPDTNASEADDD
jgi:magnesium-transporting ATPase (P-type)